MAPRRQKWHSHLPLCPKHAVQRTPHLFYRLMPTGSPKKGYCFGSVPSTLERVRLSHTSRFFSQTGAANKPSKAFSKSLCETGQSGYQQPNWKKQKSFHTLHPLLKWMVKEPFPAVRAWGQKLGTYVLSVRSCWLARVSRMSSLVAEHFPYLLIVLSLSTRGMTAPIRLERNVILPPSLYLLGYDSFLHQLKRDLSYSLRTSSQLW